MSDKLTLIVADLVRRIPDMAKDSAINNEQLLRGLLEPLGAGLALSATLEGTEPRNILDTPEFALGRILAHLLAIPGTDDLGDDAVPLTEEESARLTKHQVTAFHRARKETKIFLADQSRQRNYRNARLK